jgi:putative addiction module component (TIGR02574 family)
MGRVTETAEALREALLKLPVEDRAELAAELLASLDGPPDDGVEEAWNAEIERRVGEVDSGAVKLDEWSDVRARLEHRLRKR